MKQACEKGSISYAAIINTIINATNSRRKIWTTLFVTTRRRIETVSSFV